MWQAYHHLSWNGEEPVQRSIVARGTSLGGGQELSLRSDQRLHADALSACHQIAPVPRIFETQKATLLPDAGRASVLDGDSDVVADARGSIPGNVAECVSILGKIPNPALNLLCLLGYPMVPFLVGRVSYISNSDRRNARM